MPAGVDHPSEKCLLHSYSNVLCWQPTQWSELRKSGTNNLISFYFLQVNLATPPSLVNKKDVWGAALTLPMQDTWCKRGKKDHLNVCWDNSVLFQRTKLVMSTLQNAQGESKLTLGTVIMQIIEHILCVQLIHDNNLNPNPNPTFKIYNLKHYSK